MDSISVMFCGTAAGNLLPPCVEFKATPMYNLWRRAGPEGAKYTVTESLWFNMLTFEDCSVKIILPWACRLPGKKVIIGDNLLSHITVKVINSCKANQIVLVCLPPNSRAHCFSELPHLGYQGQQLPH